MIALDNSINNEEVRKQEMLEYIKSAIHLLEKALNVVECDENFNNGQSYKLNKIYEKTTKKIKELENI